jgi:A/G-specific adenine glycosylase
LKRLAALFVTDHRPGDWAQALMDLGSGVCRPKSPSCDRCPLAFGCEGLKTGAPERYPLKTKKAERPHRRGHAYVLTDGAGRVALVRRPDKGLLGGMTGLPTSDWGAAPSFAPPVAGEWSAAGSVEHVFTHFSLTLEVHVGTGDGGAFLWTSAKEAAASLPTVFRKALERGLAFD